MKIEDMAKEFPLHKPQCDATHRSDFYVVFTKDGQIDVAVYDERTNLWYSQTDPTGFGIVKYSPFDLPNDFKMDKDTSDLWNGEGDYEIQSRT